MAENVQTARLSTANVQSSTCHHAIACDLQLPDLNPVRLCE
jgi:hypothetical protein